MILFPRNYPHLLLRFPESKLLFGDVPFINYRGSGGFPECMKFRLSNVNRDPINTIMRTWRYIN